MTNTIDIYREYRWIERTEEFYELHQGLKESGDDPEMEAEVKALLEKCEAKLAEYTRLRQVHAKTVADSFMLGVHKLVESIR